MEKWSQIYGVAIKPATTKNWCIETGNYLFRKLFSDYENNNNNNNNLAARNVNAETVHVWTWLQNECIWCGDWADHKYVCG